MLIDGKLKSSGFSLEPLRPPRTPANSEPQGTPKGRADNPRRSSPWKQPSTRRQCRQSAPTWSAGVSRSSRTAGRTAPTASTSSPGEEDDLVFVLAQIAEDRGDGFPEEKVDRAALEKVVTAYLAKSDGNTDCAIRFDFVSMLVIGDSRAFLRHHRNCLSET